MWDKKWFGFWLQDSESREDYPDLYDWLFEFPEEYFQDVIKYIAGGEFVAASPTPVLCHVCQKEIDSSKVFLTDGEWMWAKDLIHYISEHNLHLPSRFLEKVKKHNYVCPRVDEDFDIMKLEHP